MMSLMKRRSRIKSRSLLSELKMISIRSMRFTTQQMKKTHSNLHSSHLTPWIKKILRTRDVVEIIKKDAQIVYSVRTQS